MAFDINSATVVGRLTRDGELSYTQNTNKAIYKFSIANGGGKSDSPDSVNYFDILVWDKMAEICNQYLSKGSQVVINGRLQQRRFQDKEGNNRSKVEIVASTVQFIGSNNNRVGNEENVSSQNNSHTESKSQSNSFDDDDIPF